MKYLCLIYPRAKWPAQTAVPLRVALLLARDLNQAIWRTLILLNSPAEFAVIRRIVTAGGADLCATTINKVINHKEMAMKYLCLVYSDEQKLHSLPESPKDSECQAYANNVAESGRMLAAEALEPVDSATTVRVRNGRISITDGPFAETKEQLAGFYLIEAQNLDEALDLAAGIPAARVGSVEVRPVRELQV